MKTKWGLVRISSWRRGSRVSSSSGVSGVQSGCTSVAATRFTDGTLSNPVSCGSASRRLGLSSMGESGGSSPHPVGQG